MSQELRWHGRFHEAQEPLEASLALPIGIAHHSNQSPDSCEAYNQLIVEGWMLFTLPQYMENIRVNAYATPNTTGTAMHIYAYAWIRIK
jgi:hypothetical protein